jgi:hypothetical protein
MRNYGVMGLYSSLGKRINMFKLNKKKLFLLVLLNLQEEQIELSIVKVNLV